jgi:hypothetical protein
VVEPVPVEGGAGVVGAEPLEDPEEPGEETEWEPLQELDGSNGFCGCGKSPQ